MMLALLFGLVASNSLAAEPVFRLVLAGDGGRDAGWLEDCEGCADVLFSSIRGLMDQGPSELVWLGDNVYFFGVGAPRSRRATRILARQVSASPRAADVWFVPGNHDWNQAPQGSKRVAWQADILTALGAHPAAMGEALVEARTVVEGRLRVLYLDSERAVKVGRDGKRALEELRLTLSGAPTVPTIVAMHHPLASRGHHGTARRTLFSCLRGDLSCPAIRSWEAAVATVIADHPGPVIFAGGHEHEIDLLRTPTGITQVISGAAARPSNVAATPGWAAGSDRYVGPGYAVVEVWDDRVDLRFAQLVRGSTPEDAAPRRLTPADLSAVVWSAPRPAFVAP